MAAFNFPNSPSTNDLHTENGVTYKWNGTVWKRQNASYTDATNLNVTGIATFAGNIDANGDLDVDGHTNLDNVSVAGVTTMSSTLNVSGVTNLSAELRANANIRMTNAGPKITFIDDNHNPDYEVGNSDGVLRIRDITSSVNRLAVSSTGNISISNDLDVDGHTNLDNVSVAGVSTFTGNVIASARLGLGQATPVSKLHISESGSNTVNIQLTNGTTGHTHGSDGMTIGYSSSSSTGFINVAEGSSGFLIKTGGTATSNERLVIASSGGITLPTGSLRLTDSGNSTANSTHTTGALRCNLIRPDTANNNAYTGTYFMNVNAAGGGIKSVGIVETGLRVGDFSSNLAATEKIKLTYDGHVEIKTDGGRLKIGAGNDLQMYHDNGGGTNHITCANNHHLKVSSQTLQLYDYSGVSHKMTVDTNGDVKLGTAGSYRANERILIQKTAGYNDGVVAITQNSGTVTERRFIYFCNDQGGVAGSVRHTGATACQYHTSSDYRLKENFVDITDGISRIKQLKPKRFNFKTEPDETIDGFLAHEVSPVIPDAVSGDKDGEVMQSLAYERLTPLLTAALKEAIAKIETLESEVAALKSS